MRVKRIRTSNVVGHKEVDLVLPEERGLVVIQGDNGSGKSTIIEAVAAAIWGKTLRGTAWFTDGVPARVEVETDLVNAVRERKKKRATLEWAPPGSDPVEFTTATKAQTELEKLTGAMDAWRRTSVFSSQDAMTFSLASDAERKRLIEEMLGLDIFDRALADCREKKNSAKRKLSEKQHAVHIADARLSESKKRLDDLAAELGPEPPEVDVEEGKRLVDEQNELKRKRGDAQREIGEATAAENHAIALVNQAAQAIATAEQTPNCPMCGQELPFEGRQATINSAKESQRVAEEAIAPAKERKDKALAEAQRLSEEIDALEGTIVKMRQEVTKRRAWEQAAERKRGQTEKVKADVKSAGEKLLDLEDEVDEARMGLAELEACEKVLGLRGVRAHIIGRALDGLEGVANVWIDRMLPGVSIRLRPDTELRSGGMSEKISLIVHGLNNGGDYRACSGGERRRIDVAMLLALTVIRAGSSGAHSTLFLDEVFDTLDHSGVGTVASALNDISAKRPVVVITHSSDLSAELDADQRILVENGEISQL